MTYNEELFVLNQKRHSLIRVYERKEISENDFNNQMKELVNDIKVINEKIILNLKKQFEERNKLDDIRRQKMADEKAKEKQIKKESKPKTERKPKENSRANVIAEVLQMKSVKTLEDATARVVEKLPGSKPANIKSQINAIIGLVKKGHGRWTKFTWDEANFKLVSKSQ